MIPALSPTLLTDLLLLVAGLLLWQRSCSDGDEVWVLFLRSIAAIDLAVILLSNGVLWLEIPLLVLVFGLPSVAKLEKREGRG